MTEQEATALIEKIPTGARIQLIKTNGSIFDALLVSHDVSATEARDYGVVKVPALPPAVTVRAGVRFGNIRVELDELVHIAHVGDA